MLVLELGLPRGAITLEWPGLMHMVAASSLTFYIFIFLHLTIFENNCEVSVKNGEIYVIFL
jgi:hypothetical protein